MSAKEKSYGEKKDIIFLFNACSGLDFSGGSGAQARLEF